MTISPSDLFADPAYFLYEYDQEYAHFLTMTRANFHRSIFLDGRIRRDGAKQVRVPLKLLQEEYHQREPSATNVGWIFHVAQCGSTLLARALDNPDENLVLREPAVLRRLGVSSAPSGQSGMDAARMIPMARDILGKAFNPSAPVLIKANVAVNFIANDLMKLDPEAPAVLLYFPLKNYLAAILRTQGHVDWTERVFDELCLKDSPWAEGTELVTPAQKGAMLWFAQMKIYESLLEQFENVRSLHAREIFDNPAETIVEASKLFGMEISARRADDIVASDLFHSYSKNPALDYDPEVRIAREAESLGRLSDDIAEGRKIAEAAVNRFGLPEKFAKALTGDTPLLIS